MDILNYYRKFVEKSRSLCAEYLKNRRIDVFLLTAAAAVLTLVAVHQACRVADKPKRIDISISSQCGDLFGKDTVDALIREFEEQYSHLRIQEITPEAAVAGGRSPDIVFFDDSEFGSLINASALAPLDPYRQTDDQEEQPVQWALPLVSFMDIFLYNIDILEAANCDRPPKTRVEFLAAARAVAESNPPSPEQSPVFPFALGLSPLDPLALRRDFYPWIWTSGVNINSIDISGDNPALPRAVTDTIAFLGQLNREELLAPATFEKTGTQRLEEFAAGKIAMITASTRDIAFLQNNARGVAFGITALPAITQGKNRLGLLSIYAGMSSACTQPDEAWIFLTFLAEKSNVLAEALDAVPGSFPGIFAGEYIEKNALYSKAWDIFEAADIIEYRPGQPSEEALNRIFREKLAEAFE